MRPPAGFPELDKAALGALVTDAERELIQRTRSGPVAYPLLAAVVGYGTRYAHDFPVLVPLLVGLLAVVGVARLWSDGQRRWITLAAPLLSIGLYSAFVVVALLTYGMTTPTLLALLALAGLSAGGVPGLAINLRLHYAHVAVGLLPPLIGALVASPPVPVLATMLAIYVLALLVLGQTIATDFWRSRSTHHMLARQAEELVEARMRAEYASNAKSEFLAMMSHELRTPMNGVLGMASLMQATELSTEQRGYLDVVQHSGQALLTLIDDILDLSKVEAGAVKLRSGPVDVVLLTEEVAELCRAAHNDKDLAFTVRTTDSGGRHVAGDEARLRQILTNVIGNALKFTQEGGVHTRIDTRPTSDGRVALTIVVEDSGIGVPEEKLRHIFEAFAQADSTTTRQFGGSGLGLAISRQLARMMGGDLTAENNPDGGARFTFRVTLDAATPPQTELPPPDAPRSRTVTRSALVVDDNEVNRLVIAEMLARLGWRVDTANDGKVALDSVAEQDYDVVFLDCVMPGLDGYETTRAIRRGDRQITIIGVSANAYPEDQRRAMDAGMDAYLVKPLSLDTLWRTLRENVR